MMKHLECLDRHITQYEQAIEDQLDQHEMAIQEVSDRSQTVAHSHNQVADQVNHLFDTVDKMQKSWENWAKNKRKVKRLRLQSGKSHDLLFNSL